MNSRPDHWDEPVELPAVTAPERILVPFDGSHNAERALAWAATVAAQTDAQVIVVVAYEQPLTMRGRGATYVEEIRDQLAAEAATLAGEAVDVLTRAGVNASGQVVKGDIANAILDTVDTEGGGLIIMGRQGLTAEVGGMSVILDRARDLLQGGVTAKVVRHAPVPVLVVN